jgi:hypothetical protein
MPDGLCERDILAWSQTQADLRRRLSRRERVNDVDWDNVAEEIASVGLAELNAAGSFLRQALAHLLKLQASPEAPDADHWRGEVVTCQSELSDRFSPSMRQRVDLDMLHRDAVMRVQVDDPSLSVPAGNPFTLGQLLAEDIDSLLARLPHQA